MLFFLKFYLKNLSTHYTIGKQFISLLPFSKEPFGGWKHNLRVIADSHVHGRFSYATSKVMSVKEIGRFAAIKGLGLVASGDFTHPIWHRELEEELLFDESTDSYKLKSANSPVRFLITTEVCTNFRMANKVRRVHHVILTPDFEVAD